MAINFSIDRPLFDVLDDYQNWLINSIKEHQHFVPVHTAIIIKDPIKEEYKFLIIPFKSRLNDGTEVSESLFYDLIQTKMDTIPNVLGVFNCRDTNYWAIKKDDPAFKEYEKGTITTEFLKQNFESKEGILFVMQDKNQSKTTICEYISFQDGDKVLNPDPLVHIMDMNEYPPNQKSLTFNF